MSNDGARTARCSRDGDAIHRAHDFSERRLERSGAFLRVTQKSAWHKGFCAVAILGASAGARARREIFSPRCTRELSQSDDSGLLKIFFTKASRKRARDRIRDRTRANRWSGDSRRAFGAALGGRAARKFSGAMRAVARRTARVWPASCGRAAIGAPGVSFRRFSTAKRKDPTGGDRPARVGANGLLIAAAAGPSSHRSELSAESIASRAIFDFADARQVECSTPTRRMRSNQ